MNKVTIKITTRGGKTKAVVIAKETLLHKDRSAIRKYLIKKKVDIVEWL
jgi:hypothetical protein